MIGPAILGAGTPAFEGGRRIPLRLLNAHALEGSQLVLHRYDARPAGTGRITRARRDALMIGDA